LATKTLSPKATIWHCLYDPRFDIILGMTDTHTETDRQTHVDGIYRASIALCSKNLKNLAYSTKYLRSVVPIFTKFSEL